MWGREKEGGGGGGGGVHLPCGCIHMSYRGCIYGEILIKFTVFAFFGGAFAPSINNTPSSPILILAMTMTDGNQSTKPVTVFYVYVA